MQRDHEHLRDFLLKGHTINQGQLRLRCPCHHHNQEYNWEKPSFQFKNLLIYLFT